MPEAASYQIFKNEFNLFDLTLCGAKCLPYSVCRNQYWKRCAAAACAWAPKAVIMQRRGALMNLSRKCLQKPQKVPDFPQGPWTPKNTCKKLTCVTFYYLVYVRTHNLCYQRKLGSNTSELRMTFTMMKGGARSILDGIDYDEGWCVI